MPEIWCIPFISNIIYYFHLYLIVFIIIIFGSKVNLCSVETVVGEFEVMNPVLISNRNLVGEPI